LASRSFCSRTCSSASLELLEVRRATRFVRFTAYSSMPARQSTRLSLRDRAFVAVMCAALGALTANYAILATFFPIHMGNRGMSMYMISLVFVAFDIGKLTTSIFAGALASRLGRRVLLVAGILLSSAFGCLIGMIPSMVSYELDIMSPLLIAARALQGSGVALAQQSIFAILGDTFPQSRGLVMGAAGAMLALGYFVGPPVGGALYGLSGFALPFLVNGLLVAAFALPILSLYPTVTPALAGSALSLEVEPGTAAPTAAEEEKPASMAASDSATAPAYTASVQSTARVWLRTLQRLPADVWLLTVVSMLYFSKWGWWDMWFTSWVVNEFGFSIQGASVCISLIAGCFGLGAPMSGWLGDRLSSVQRMGLIAATMGALSTVHFFFGPWQLHSTVLGAAARRSLFFIYLPTDGLLSCLLEPQLMPTMLSLAEAGAAEVAAVGAGAGGSLGNAATVDVMGRGEHLTNLVTALAQTAINIGSVIGPFVAVPLVKAGGFRSALAAWAPAYALVSCLAWWRVLRCNCCASRRVVRPAVQQLDSIAQGGKRTCLAEVVTATEGSVAAKQRHAAVLVPHASPSSTQAARRYSSLEDET